MTYKYPSVRLIPRGGMTSHAEMYVRIGPVCVEISYIQQIPGDVNIEDCKRSPHKEQSNYLRKVLTPSRRSQFPSPQPVGILARQNS